MIWLASFPRSGNTYFRNILFEVYGISSSAYHHDPNIKKDLNFESHAVVKTHLLPSQLPDHLQEAKSVYLVRDPRDALLSLAHHRKDLIEAGSDLYLNLQEAILAENGSHFGGWTENTRQWVAKADIVIRFQDLVADPIGEVERLRAILDLPPPEVTKLPTFEQLKSGEPRYGSSRKQSTAGKDRNRKMFRKGIVGGWKDELPSYYERIIYENHGKQMKCMGYEIRDLSSFEPFLELNEHFDDVKTHQMNYELVLLKMKNRILRILPPTLAELLSSFYRRLPIRPVLGWFRNKAQKE